MEDDTSESEVCLPADTLQILNEFLLEKARKEQQEFELIQSRAGKEANFDEDWQLSQFWYNEDTKNQLRSVVQKLLGAHDTKNYRIALLSCPSLYCHIKELHHNVQIFEYDKRFAAYGNDFVFYDFNEAETSDYLKEHWETYDLIIADPPFLSEECITKIAIIIKHLLKSANSKIIFCSGEIVEPWLKRTLALEKCAFRPNHARNLGNEFVSYANFNLDDLM